MRKMGNNEKMIEALQSEIGKGAMEKGALVVLAGRMLNELRDAHAIIRAMLNLLTPEQKFALSEQAEYIIESGITRANEREALIAEASAVLPASPEQAAPVAVQSGERSVCVCGDPASQGVTHRTDGPCYVTEAPTPSAETIDTDEFKLLLVNYRNEWDDVTEPRATLIAHIDARMAAARQEGYEQGFIHGQEKIDVIRQKLNKAETALAAAREQALEEAAAICEERAKRTPLPEAAMADELNLMPCPFCDWQASDDLADVVYPTGIYAHWMDPNDHSQGMHFNRTREGSEAAVWHVGCTENMGGCGASVEGIGRDGAIAAWNRRAAPSAEASAKPFPAPGAWFPTDVLGNPMREYEPGKWEVADWPSSTPAEPIVREQREAAQRERMVARFANRPRTPATADFDLPAPNDALPAEQPAEAQGEGLTDSRADFEKLFITIHQDAGYVRLFERLADDSRYCSLEVEYAWLTYRAIAAHLRAAEAKTQCTMGVGSGSGSLFVHGDYESIKACQSLILRAAGQPVEASAQAEELPPLPQSHEFVVRGIPRHVFTADQMRDYARAAIAAHLRAAGKIPA